MPFQFANQCFPVIAMCELCNHEPASCFVAFNQEGGIFSQWKFCGGCDDSTENYIVMIDDFFDNPASTTEELAELHKHGNDWQDFMDMMVRFQKATQSFDQ